MNGKDLRIVFMGTPDFAVASLKMLVENNYQIVGVVTAPDKPAGRGQQLSQSAVKIFAIENGLTVLQPEKLKSPEFIDELKQLKADLQIVVAFRMLPEIVWAMPRFGTFNLHASLLPKYRGAAPINWAIMNGETESGVTTFLLQQEIDTGNILFQEKVSIAETDNVEHLHDNLMNVGSHLVIKTIDAIAEGNLHPISQNELEQKGYMPTPAPKLFKENCMIDWNLSGITIRNNVRGLSPYPTAWTTLCHSNNNETLNMKVFEVSFIEENHKNYPGYIATDKKSTMKIACSDGWIFINSLQLAGKKRMQTAEFLRGFQKIDQFLAK